MHHGLGRMESPNGYIYEGAWVDGVKEGKGKITYPDGAIYEGDLVRGQREGTGTLTMPDGLIYEGAWAGGQINGSGRLTQPNGDIYEGDLVNGERQGNGKVIYANGDENYFIAICFACRPVSGEPRPDGEESLAAAYFPPDALPAMSPKYRIRIEHALRGDQSPYFHPGE